MSEILLFNANSAIVQLYHGENKLICNEMMMRSSLYQTNTLIVGFLQCQLTETTVRRYICRTHYPDSVPSRLCSFSLLLCVERRNKYQFNSLWLYPIGARTRNLPHTIDAVSNYNEVKCNCQCTIWALSSCLTHHFIFEVTEPSQYNERSCICRLRVSGLFFPHLAYFIFDLFRQRGILLFSFCYYLNYAMVTPSKHS